MTKNLPDIYTRAIKGAIVASAAILEVYNSDFELNYKEDGSLITKADLASSKLIEEALLPSGIPITGEELVRKDYSVRSGWTENWCVDPLDGTKMFAQRNGEFSVNIAHIKNGVPIFGIIGAPVEQRFVIGGPDYGVFIFNFDEVDSPSQWKEQKQKEQLNDTFTISCSRAFSEYKYPIVKEFEQKYGEINYVRKGSALKFFDLAEGISDVYLRFAPTMEWDIAAGQAILETLGGTVKSIPENKQLSYNKESLFNPNFIARTKAALTA